MRPLSHRWRSGGEEHELSLAPVPGSLGTPFPFGREPHTRPIEIGDFHMSSTPVTNALWMHVMGEEERRAGHLRRPADEVSWEHITRQGGFLDRVNASPILDAVSNGDRTLRFRLPSETEWEYAARGGPHWRDGFRFSGSNDIDAVAWYGNKWKGGAAKWRLMRFLKHAGLWDPQRRGFTPTRTHDVAAKAPNQLGLYDMSGNVWEWCQDVCTDDLDAVPRDGAPYLGDGSGDRRLRGGCHHNWDIHCTVWWRYGIAPDAHDGCIGFRLVLAPSP